MTKAYLVLLATSACTGTSSDQPRLSAWSDDGGVHVSLERGYDHDLSGVTATIDGRAAAAPVVEPGRPGTIGNPPADAVATFRIAPSGSGMHAVLDDGGETFVIDVPDLNVRRTLDVKSSLDAPLTGNESIALATNLATDAVGEGSELVIVSGDTVCSWATHYAKQGDAWVFPLTPGFTDWYCGPRPAAGSQVAATMHFSINVSAPVATCTNATCSATPLGGALETDVAVRLQL